MVADALIYHPSVNHYLKFVATTVGRDKFLRTIQYFSRFYAWYLYRLNATPAEIAPYDAIKKQFGLIRKALRLGKSVEHLKAAAQAADAHTMDPVLRYCAIGRQLGYAGYMALDNAHFLDVSGIRRLESAKRIQEVGFRMWWFGLACNIVSGVYQRFQLAESARGVDRKEGEGVVESKRLERLRSEVNLQLISDLCDITVPTFGLGYTGFLDDGLVGLAGTVSSLIGMQTVWKKTA